MIKITVIIVVKNEPPHLLESIRSVEALADEIIIGNIQMNETLKKQLNKNNKIKIIELPSYIAYADLIKEDLKKKALGEYILYLDPDEIFPELQLASLVEKYDYFYFPRKNIIFGKWIRHSRWWPDYQLRLFKKNAVIWPKQLHPIPEASGKEYKLPAEEKYSLIHYNYDNLDQYLEKAIRYAKSEASVLVNNDKNYSLLTAIRQAVSEFISRFFAYEGYKDGMHGFTLSMLQMFYYFLVYLYYWQEKRYFNIDQKEIIKATRFFSNVYLKETNYWLIKKKLINKIEEIKLKVLSKLI